MKLTNIQREDIEFTIEDMFFHLKARLLGKYFTGPKIYFEVVEQTNPLDTLEGVYNFTYSMLYGAGAKPNPKRVKQLMKITGNYLDAERLRTVNHVLNAIESAKTFDDVKEVVEKQMEKTNGYVNMLVGNEIRNIQANAEKEGIEKLGAAIGVEDPVVCKLGVVDDKLCKYCRPLWHTDENPMIPKVYKLSELKDGYMNHKDPQPTVLASHPHCFTADTKIYTKNGVYTIKELFDLNLPFDATVDIRIPLVGDKSEVWRERGTRLLPSSHVYETGIQEIIKISTGGGDLKVTGDHDVWVQRKGNSPVQKKAKELVVGDRLLMISGECHFGEDSWEKEAELLGSFYGDGTYSKGNGIHLQFFDQDIEYGLKLQSVLHSLYKSKYHHKEHKTATQKTDAMYSDDVRFIRYSSVPLFEFAKTKGFKNKHNVPDLLWKSDKLTIAAFLRGLFAADGTVNVGNKTHTSRIMLGTSIESFAVDIRMLLSMFGIKAKVFKTDGGRKIQFKRADGSLRDSVCGDLYRVVISGTDKYIFNRFIGFPQEYKKFKAEKTRNVKEPASCTKITKIELLPEEMTYCMTQPENNTITANGFVVGQCRHILTMIPPNFGVTDKGVITFKGFGYDIYAEQRGE